jgi:hypothetical protein
LPRFKHYNYDQDAMVVINYQEQFQPCTFEHAVHYLIEHKLDLSVFHPKYRNEDTGRLAYDPVLTTRILTALTVSFRPCSRKWLVRANTDRPLFTWPRIYSANFLAINPSSTSMTVSAQRTRSWDVLQPKPAPFPLA